MIAIIANQQWLQGFKKVQAGRPGQVDFCVGQVTVPIHLPDGQGYRQANCELNLGNYL